MKENVERKKSIAFAVRVVKLYQFLCPDKKEFVLSNQLLRSGTSVGASIHRRRFTKKFALSIQLGRRHNKRSKNDYSSIEMIVVF